MKKRRELAVTAPLAIYHDKTTCRVVFRYLEGQSRRAYQVLATILKESRKSEK